jgi:hypothetical protein
MTEGLRLKRGIHLSSEAMSTADMLPMRHDIRLPEDAQMMQAPKNLFREEGDAGFGALGGGRLLVRKLQIWSVSAPAGVQAMESGDTAIEGHAGRPCRQRKRGHAAANAGTSADAGFVAVGIGGGGIGGRGEVDTEAE